MRDKRRLSRKYRSWSWNDQNAKDSENELRQMPLQLHDCGNYLLLQILIACAMITLSSENINNF